MAEGLGWQHVRTSGDHFVYERRGDRLKLSIPNHRTVREGTLHQIVKTMGLTVDDFLARARK